LTKTKKMNKEEFIKITMFFVFFLFVLFTFNAFCETLNEIKEKQKAFCPDYIFRTAGWGHSQTFCPQGDGTIREFICEDGECYWLEVKK